MQLNKMGLIDSSINYLNVENSIQSLSVLLEKNNRNAFNQVIAMQREMYLNSMTIFNKEDLINISSELLKCSKLRLKIHQDGCLVNFPKNFYQLDIPDNDMKNLEVLPMEINVGDLVIFNQNMPHTSNVNNSSQPSFAYILRIYDFTNDRTLSNNNGVKRYTADAAQNGFINFNI
jgi:hypothetical protein